MKSTLYIFESTTFFPGVEVCSILQRSFPNSSCTEASQVSHVRKTATKKTCTIQVSDLKLNF